TKSTGIPISVGFARTKTLAKIANKIAKKFPERTSGVYCIDSDEQRIKALRWTNIEDVWGVGRKFSKRLREQGVVTANDFLQLSDSWISRYMSVVGMRIKKELQGIACYSLETEYKSKQQIATTRSF